MGEEKCQALEDSLQKEYSNIAGLVVLKDGEMQYERYFNGCGAEDPIPLFSVTKSIVSLLIGIALDQGCLESVEQKVLTFFPEYVVKQREKTLQQIALKHLLTMTAPYKYRSTPYTRYFASGDWVKAALDFLGGQGTIGEFRYAPVIGPDILSGILVKATGQSVLAFAQENLLTPLGISAGGPIVFQSKEEQLAYYHCRSIKGWVADPQGVNTAGWGLSLTARDLAKIGKLYLQDGAWEGRQLISAKWLKESTQEHSRWAEEDRRYGYLWWLLEEKENTFAALGDGGNVLYVNPSNGLVIAITSLFRPRAKDRLPLIKGQIEPLFK